MLARRSHQGCLDFTAAVKDQYANANICGNNRVVFNVGGYKYRLVVEMQYRAGTAWVKFIGTHAEYDRINVETVNDH
jgi:mRNA interferase HigB